MTFGDFDPDDAVATEPADPEQVARYLHELRRDRGFDDGRRWHELAEADRTVLEAIAAALLDLLRRQGSGP